MFGALKNVEVTRMRVKPPLCREELAYVHLMLALPVGSGPLVVFHLEPEMVENLTNVTNVWSKSKQSVLPRYPERQ